MCEEINIPELIELSKLDEKEEEVLQGLSIEKRKRMQNLKIRIKRNIDKIKSLGKTRIKETILEFKKRIERLKLEEEENLFFEKWSLSLGLEILKNES